MGAITDLLKKAADKLIGDPKVEYVAEKYANTPQGVSGYTMRKADFVGATQVSSAPAPSANRAPVTHNVYTVVDPKTNDVQVRYGSPNGPVIDPKSQLGAKLYENARKDPSGDHSYTVGAQGLEQQSPQQGQQQRPQAQQAQPQQQPASGMSSAPGAGKGNEKAASPMNAAHAAVNKSGVSGSLQTAGVSVAGGSASSPPSAAPSTPAPQQQPQPQSQAR